MKYTQKSNKIRGRLSNTVTTLACCVSQVIITLASATIKTVWSHRNVYVTCITKNKITQSKSRWWTNLTYAMSFKQTNCYVQWMHYHINWTICTNDSLDDNAWGMFITQVVSALTLSDRHAKYVPNLVPMYSSTLLITLGSILFLLSTQYVILIIAINVIIITPTTKISDSNPNNCFIGNAWSILHVHRYTTEWQRATTPRQPYICVLLS